MTHTNKRGEKEKKLCYDIRLFFWRLMWKFPNVALYFNVEPHIYYPREYMRAPKENKEGV